MTHCAYLWTSKNIGKTDMNQYAFYISVSLRSHQLSVLQPPHEPGNHGSQLAPVIDFFETCNPGKWQQWIKANEILNIHIQALRLWIDRLPICFLSSDLTNQKQEPKNSDCETSWLVYFSNSILLNPGRSGPREWAWGRPSQGQSVQGQLGLEAHLGLGGGEDGPAGGSSGFLEKG